MQTHSHSKAKHGIFKMTLQTWNVHSQCRKHDYEGSTVAKNNSTLEIEPLEPLPHIIFSTSSSTHLSFHCIDHHKTGRQPQTQIKANPKKRPEPSPS